jgi:hydroxyquinol 1,2-dioxygenase
MDGGHNMTDEPTVGTAAGWMSPADITTAVVASFAHCDSPRLRFVMQRLVEHLHAFALDVHLSQDEWEVGTRFLTDIGHITSAERQEFILLSDTLGLSMLVDAINHEQGGATTESTVLGPFWSDGSPYREYGDNLAERPVDVPVWVFGRVLGPTGEPIGDATLDIWQNDEDRLYAVQNPEAPEHHLRGRFRTRPDGTYAFLAARPTAYPIPDDGPVGQMLEASGRHPWRPAHIHIRVEAPGHQSLTTHIFDADSDYLDSDTVFAVKPSLIRDFVRRTADDPERPDAIGDVAGSDGTWYSVENDVVLAPSRETRAEAAADNAT